MQDPQGLNLIQHCKSGYMYRYSRGVVFYPNTCFGCGSSSNTNGSVANWDAEVKKTQNRLLPLCSDNKILRPLCPCSDTWVIYSYLVFLRTKPTFCQIYILDYPLTQNYKDETTRKALGKFDFAHRNRMFVPVVFTYISQYT